MRPYYEITTDDVGASWIRAFGRTWLVVNFIGQLLPQDVGKRCYCVGDHLQIENDEQRHTRLTTQT